MWLFRTRNPGNLSFQTPEITEPLVSLETRGSVYIEFGGEGSKALGRPQSFMSDVESGTRRLDLVQLRDLYKVLGITLTELVIELESVLQKAK